ncbi:MAG: YheU family protein [Gammaproteobacteria bacterium]|nr:YheU family protein [Gammaproteobacteria bacterium]
MRLVSYRSLSRLALNNVVDEFVSRDGDIVNGSMAQKRKQVLAVLKSGDAVISYDDRSKTTNIHTKVEWDRIQAKVSREDSH